MLKQRNHRAVAHGSPTAARLSNGLSDRKEHRVTTRIVLSSKFLRFALDRENHGTERSQNAFVLNCELFTDCSGADLNNNFFPRVALIFVHGLLLNN